MKIFPHKLSQIFLNFGKHAYKFLKFKNFEKLIVIFLPQKIVKK
ncbi:hypothetical protein HMPREF1552_00045 [Leptotrichia sp. oral taxon 879 str. F0557]|nr:hypothetical protein HMPREF1552_00045 [Leptotrichia sp. oral taxon 879 str. F0557]